MKKFVLAIIQLCLTSTILLGQSKFIICEVDFESPLTSNCVFGFYSVENNPSPTNIWQVCIPNKPLFNQSLSPIHAILTDSIGPYPVNDTSVFILKSYVEPTGANVPIIGGWYKFDSDSLKDFGRIDVSYDHGVTWRDVLTDTTIFWTTQKPVFTGRVYQWTQFSASFLSYPIAFDTLYLKYTFISDSIQTNQQGWMLDDLYVVDHIEGLHNLGNDMQVNVYPNPSNERITLKISNYHGSINVSIFTIFGGTRLHQVLINNESDIDISSLPEGMYMINVVLDEQVRTLKFLKR